MNKALICLFISSALILTWIEAKEQIDENNVKLYLYWSLARRDVYSLPEFVSIHNNVHFNNSNPTIIYGHGYVDSADSDNAKTVVDAYLTRGGWNVIAVDWSAYAYDGYFLTVVPNLNQIGVALGKYLTNFMAHENYYDKVHLVGHSLGGQLMGLTARTVKEKANGKFQVKRVTGLDPAGPGFDPQLAGAFQALSSSDATFVDVIHSDAGYYGSRKPIGSVDFFPNGGTRYQSGCKRKPIIPDETQSGPLGNCSHMRSLILFVETVLNSTVYSAVRCESYSDFIERKCDGNEMTYMGFSTPNNVNGTFYLKTGDGSD